MSIAVNTRVMQNSFTGMQRYIHELLPRIGIPYVEVHPRFRMTSLLNQGWEQVALPAHARGRLLWSPANTGPLAVRNQVLTIHDLAPLDHPEWYHSGFAAYFSWLLRALTPKVRRVITTSTYSRDRIVALTGVPASHVEVIHSGVDERFSPRAPAEITEARRVLGITAPRYVFYLGSIEPRKNIRRLLEAWAACRSSCPSDLVLVIGGSRANPKAFRRVNLAAPDDRVVYLGQVDRRWIPAILSGATAFVYPSLYEGFGFPPLEAMACGTPTLTSNATSIPEVVGDAALTVDPLDGAAIARGLTRMVGEESLRNELSAKGLERSRQFTWEKSAEHTRAVLQSCD